MAECLINKKGGGIDLDGVNATPNDVADGETFYGAGSDDIQTGVLPILPVVNQKIGINESYTVPRGINRNDSYVYQDIERRAGFTIKPVADGSSAMIAGKYMNGNVDVEGVDNLVPENIRLGAFIGSVSGTFQGYVNNDIYTPFWYGIFAPGQTGSVKKNRTLGGLEGSVTANWNYYDASEDDGKRSRWVRFRSVYDASYPYRRSWAAISFNTPIDMTGAKSITIEYKLQPRFASDHTWLIVSENNTTGALSDRDWNITSALGQRQVFVIPASANNGTGWSTQTFTLPSGTTYYYINIGLGVYQDQAYGDSYMDVRYVKINR